MTQMEVAKRAKGLSRQTVAKAEAGHPIKFETLEQLAGAARATAEDRRHLWADWLRERVGPEVAKVLFAYNGGGGEAGGAPEQRWVAAVSRLGPEQQAQLLAALEHAACEQLLENFLAICQAIIQHKESR